MKSKWGEQLAILKLVACGLSNADIAQRLYLSEGTYVNSILSKLDVADRTQAAVIAMRYGLTDLKEV
jgi:DNA-binding NarL/FixJ family response regulator